MALDPDYVPARILLAKVLIEQGHYRAAAAELEKLREQRPESDEMHYLLAVAQEKDGRLEEALVNYRRAHALNEKNLAAVTAAAEVLVSMGKVRQAQLQLDSYLSVATDDPGMYELAGRLAMMQKEYADASRHYAQACALDHKNLRYRESLGLAQFFAGEHQRAVDTLKGLLESEGYQGGAWVYTMLGDCYMAMSRPFQARDVYQTASQRCPDSAGVLINLGKVAMALNDVSRAILSAQQALNLEAGQLDAALLMGYALLRDGQVQRAARFLAQTVAQHPENGTLQCLLGRVHAAAGDKEQAARCYLAALKLEPENRLALELLCGPRHPPETEGQ